VKDRQIELLAYIREKAPEKAQWTDIKKLIVKWLDTPPLKRELVSVDKTGTETGKETHTDSGCTLGGGNPTDRDYEHNLNTLRREVCKGILAISMDFDIYNYLGGHRAARPKNGCAAQKNREARQYFQP